MRLIVQYGKPSKRNTPFHPALKIDPNSGYCANQWNEQHFREGCFTGARCVASTPVAQAIADYFADLRRMNYVEVKS